jgi:hypothetical protein
MDMRVVEQRARPGVEDGDAAERGADVAGVVGQVLDRCGGAPHQRAVDNGLMTKRHGAISDGNVMVTK